MKLKIILPFLFLAAAMFLAGAFCGYLIQYEEPAPIVQITPHEKSPYADMAESLGSAEQYFYYAIENLDGQPSLATLQYKGKKALPKLRIPSTADGFPLTAVTGAVKIDADCHILQYGEGIERIGPVNWSGKVNTFLAVSVPDTVRVIGKDALTGATYSFRDTPGDGQEGVLELPGADLEYGALSGVRAQTVKLGEGCERIEEGAFAYSEFTELYLPSTVHCCRGFCREKNESCEIYYLTGRNVTIHYAGTPAQLAGIDFGCPLPEEVTVVYD